MEIITAKEHSIITPLSPKLDLNETIKLVDEINNLNSPKIGIDLTYVKDCTSDFFDAISKFGNISLFNISSDIFALLSFMKFDRIVKIYVSKLDFIENKRQIINPRLKVLG